MDEQGLFTFLSNPDISKEALIGLRDLTQKAQIQGYSEEQFAGEAERIDPLFKQLWKWIKPENQANFFALLTFIASVIGMIYPKDDKPTVVNNYYFNAPPTQGAPSPNLGKSIPSPNLKESEPKNTNKTPPKKKCKRGGGLYEYAGDD